MDKKRQSGKGEYFNVLIENSDDIIIGVSNSFSIILFNKIAADFFKVSQKNILDKNLFEFFTLANYKAPISVNYFANPKAQKSKSGTYKMKAQITLEWKIIPIFSDSGEIKSAMLIAKIIHNINETNFAKSLSQIVDHTPGSLYWKDKEGRYLGCNQFMVKTSGLNSADDIVGKTDFDLWPENAKKLYKNDQYVIKKDKTTFTEEEVKIPKGDSMYFTCVKMPLRDKSGEIIGMIGNSLDITKLKKTEKALREAKEKAESANTLKANFIRNMHHDIRTPFSGIVGLTDLLHHQETDPQKREILGDILQSSKGLLDFCNNILDFSKSETGSFPVLSKCFNLRKLVDDIVVMEKPPAKIKKLGLIVNYDKNLPAIIIGDNYRLKRILINLISNAIKFTEKGSVEISITSTKTKGNNRRIIVKFTIKDTGIGIPESDRNLIYERFTKISPSNKGLYQGQGLGLGMVKQFLTEMDGDIHLKSKVGKGSAFTILLPFKKPLTDEIIDDE
jgi:two-component system, OmpR family, aerobic respiration control sensor histidine kinase ArcB